MQQLDYQTEFQEDFIELTNLKIEGPLHLGQFGPEGINLNYTDRQENNYQVGVLHMKKLIYEELNFQYMIDNIQQYCEKIRRLKNEQILHQNMNNQTQILKIQQPQRFPLFFRHEQWQYTLFNHMVFMDCNHCKYPLNYFFVLAKQLIYIINSLHQNNISHRKITPDNIVIRKETQYYLEFFPEPNEEQYYQFILNEYKKDYTGTSRDLKNRINTINVDQQTKELFLEGKISPSICVESSFVKKIVDISRIAKQHGRDIRYVNFKNIIEYENDQIYLTNFSEVKQRNEIMEQDWQDYMIKDYHDLGIILYFIYIQTFGKKNNYNFANLQDYEIIQQIIQILDEQNDYERILIFLLDGQHYQQASLEIQQKQIQMQYTYQHYVYEDQMSFYQS